MMKKISPFASIAQFFASGFGSGCSPFAPGTIGTIAALPFWYGLSFLSLPVYLMIVILSTVLGFWICGKAAKELKVHDHGGIVWDEFVGVWIALIHVPVSIFSVLLGFALFRLFDVIKPWPISYIDKKVDGGFGIMLDDILAGILACIVMQICLYYGVIS